MTLSSYKLLLSAISLIIMLIFYACLVLMQQQQNTTTTIMMATAAEEDGATVLNNHITDTAASRHLQHHVLNASNFVDIKSNSSLQLTKFSVAAWFRTSEDYRSGTNYHFIVNKGGFGQERPGFNMNYGIWVDSRERLHGGFESLTGEDNFVVSRGSYNDGEWHYAVLTFDGRTINLYVDGTKEASNSTTATPDYTGIQPVSVGVNSLALGGFFIGHIDEVRIWNRTLSDQEVKDQYSSSNSTAFDTQGLVLYLSFNS